jgi:hypothetical protein
MFALFHAKKSIIHCQVKIHFKNLSGLHHIIRLIALISLGVTNFASFAARINNRLPGGVYVAQLGHCNSVPRELFEFAHISCFARASSSLSEPTFYVREE